MPSGFLTEDGPCPEFAACYGARAMPTADYPERTHANVRDSDGTLWFGATDTPGAAAGRPDSERVRGGVVLDRLGGRLSGSRPLGSKSAKGVEWEARRLA